MKQKGSMRELDLDIKFDYIVTSNVDPALAKTYQNLSRLQRLTTSISDLSEVVQSGEEEDDIKVVLGRIPLSIEVLKPRCCKFLTDWISHDLLTEPYLEGMQELLEEAGPRGRFSSLRVLDLSETFMDDHSMVDVRKIKELAKSKGVNILLYN